MPHPGQHMERVDFSAPAQLHRAAERIGWAMELQRREVMRIALALGLNQMGALFNVAPETVAVKLGRPPATNPTDD